MSWCKCRDPHAVIDDADLDEDGACPACGLPERAWFVGAVLAQLDDLDHAQTCEVLEEALDWCQRPPDPGATLHRNESEDA